MLRHLICFGLAGQLAVIAGIVASANTVNAVCLSGYVRDASEAPVANVDLDFIDPATGAKLITPGDNTDASGFYNVCVLPGIYDVTFAPRRGTHLIGTQILNVDLSNNQSRQANVVLASGLVVSGRITDSLGNAIGDIDIDLDSLAGGRVYTGDDNSSPIDGSFWVVVPPGSYRLRFDPPPGTGWRGLQVDTILIAADTTLDIVLHRGFQMSGIVRTEFGDGIPDVDFELKLPSGEKIFVADNTTDANGQYGVVVPPGTFELRFVPLFGSRWIGSSYADFQIDGDSLWSEVLSEGILVSAIVTDQSGVPISAADLDFNIPGTGSKLFTPHDKTDRAGLSINAIPPGVYDLEVDPPLGAPYDRLTLVSLNCENDTDVVAKLPEVRRVQVQGQVQGIGATGIPQVTLEVRSTVTGAKLFVQNNVTDQSGAFDLSVPTGALDFFFIPSVASRYAAAVSRNLQINNDTTLSAIELDAGLILTCHVIDRERQSVTGATIDVSRANEVDYVYTPFNETDQDGRAQLVLAPGSYDVLVTPPAGSSLESTKSGIDLVDSDSSITFELFKPSVETEEAFILHANYPNPFATETTIKYELIEAAHTNLRIYTVAGEFIATLVDEPQSPGEYRVSWDGRNRDGHEISDGVYICMLRANKSSKLLKLVRIRR